MQYAEEAGIANKVVTAEKLAVAWLETRTPREMTIYRQVMEIAHHIIAEGFSEQVITPGVTTTEEVEWWYRDRIRQLGLVAWFHPTVDVQRASTMKGYEQEGFSSRPGVDIIEGGDLLHVDFGITYLRFNTDTQQLAYVLKAGEHQAPVFLEEALASGNAVQNDLTSSFAVGKSGNTVLAEALKKGRDAGRKPWIYTHPIGYHGHAAGPAIGMWDAQEGVPGSGEYLLRPNTAYSIELNNTIYVEQWGKDIRIMLEEDAFFDGESVTYINGRQKKLILIPRQNGILGQ
jgi:Xaa-Pro aminopeptidase